MPATPKTVKKAAKKPTNAAAAKKTASPIVGLATYLAFNGNCEKAFNFYRKVFGGEFCCVFRNRDIPPSASMEINPKHRNRIMHMGLPIGSMTLMGSDGCPDNPVTPGDAVTLYVGAPDAAEAKRIFKALSAGGKVIMPLAPTFFAKLFGLAVDRFGVSWMVRLCNMETPG